MCFLKKKKAATGPLIRTFMKFTHYLLLVIFQTLILKLILVFLTNLHSSKHLSLTIIEIKGKRYINLNKQLVNFAGIRAAKNNFTNKSIFETVLAV